MFPQLSKDNQLSLLKRTQKNTFPDCLLFLKINIMHGVFFFESVYIPMLVFGYTECSRNEIGFICKKTQFKKGKKPHLQPLSGMALTRTREPGKLILHLPQHRLPKPVSEQPGLLLIPGELADLLRRTQVIEYCSLDQALILRLGGRVTFFQ